MSVVIPRSYTKGLFYYKQPKIRDDSCSASWRTEERQTQGGSERGFLLVGYVWMPCVRQGRIPVVDESL